MNLTLIHPSFCVVVAVSIHVNLISLDVSVFVSVLWVCPRMPQRVQCQKCKAVLFEGVELTPPDEIIQRFDGRCPKCGKKLTFEIGNVTVKPIK